MKKSGLLVFTALSAVLLLLTGCKNDIEPVTIPDTLIEHTEENTESVPAEDHTAESTQPEDVSNELAAQIPQTEPATQEENKPQEVFSFWDQIYDYSQDQPALHPDGDIKNLSIQLGSTPDELYITWFSKSGSRGHVNFVKNTGGTPLSATVTTQGSVSVPNYFRNRAIITGLEPNTDYQYQVGNGSVTSAIYNYQSGDFSSSEFSFTIASDQEIGLGDLDDNVYEIHSTDWRLGLNRMKEQIPDSGFLLSLGDHVARKDAPIEYDLFLDQSVLYSTALMPVVGNHDAGSGFFGDHFSLPNLSPHGHADGNDGDYWFVYGNTLFMVLNNLSVCDSVDHELFIMETLETAPETKWRVLVSHYSPVSNVERYQGSAESVDDYYDYAELYDIDLFIGGHDHVYTRSFLMTDDDEFLSTADQNEFRNPEGAIYVVLSSATSSLYRQPDHYPWAAVSIQTEHPQISKAHVTENSFTITTYEADTWKQLDSFTIYKD